MKMQRALSVRQPHAENILRGIKRSESRSTRTHIRERVYIYASTKPADAKLFASLRCSPGDLPTGVLVGSVEIVGCTGSKGRYKWHLERPRRLLRRVKPTRQPQPVWFRPFLKAT